MSAWARVSLAVLIAGLVVVGLLRDDDGAQVSRTSFGTVPPGYRGAYEVLAALGVPVAREFAGAARLAPGGTVWWIEPQGLCVPAEPAPAPEAAGMADPEWSGRAWVEAGGVAVVFLPQDVAQCAAVAGVRLPARLGLATGAPPTPHPSGRRRLADLWPQADRPEVPQIIDGPLQARAVRTGGLATFADAGDWTMRAVVDERPYALEHRLGAGRLVVIADPAPLQNAWVDKADAAPWVTDLVKTWGVPRFDEHAHGLRPEDSAVRFLARSPALGVFLALAALGGVVAWRGLMLPPRTTGGGAAAAPVLEPFVDALAALYARTRDHDQVARRYRDLAVARLSRHLGLPPGTTATVLAERLQGSRGLTATALRRALDPSPVRSERDLQALARAVDDLMREVGA